MIQIKSIGDFTYSKTRERAISFPFQVGGGRSPEGILLDIPFLFANFTHDS